MTVVDHEPVDKPTFKVSLYLLGPGNVLTLTSVEVVGVDLVKGQQIPTFAPIALVGRDVLRTFTFSYDGKSGVYSLRRV